MILHFITSQIQNDVHSWEKISIPKYESKLTIEDLGEVCDVLENSSEVCNQLIFV